MRPTLGGIVVFAVLATIYILAPHRLPGEQPEGELTGTGTPLCAACPWEEQITAVGLEHNGDGAWLTARFAAPPSNARFTLLSSDARQRVTFEQVSPDRWTLSTPAGSRLPLRSFRVAMRDDRVVWEMPGALAQSGVAILSSGGRFPASGVLPASVPPRPRRNAIDLGVMLTLIFGGALGYWRGAARATWLLVSFAAVLGLARLLFEPVAEGLRMVSADSPPVSYIFSLAAASAIVWITTRIARAPATRLVEVLRAASPKAASATWSAAAGVAWATAVAAMVLAVSSELTALDWAYRTIQASSAAQVLISGWHSLLPPIV